MADSDYKGLASLLAETRKRAYATNPYLGAAGALTPSKPLDVSGMGSKAAMNAGIASGLTSIAQGLLGAYGARQANQQVGDTAQRALGYIRNDDYESMAADPDPGVRELALTLALTERQNKQSAAEELNKLFQSENIKAGVENYYKQQSDPRLSYLRAAGVDLTGAGLPSTGIESNGLPPTAAPATPQISQGVSAQAMPTPGISPTDVMQDPRMTQLVVQGFTPQQAAEWLMKQDEAAAKPQREADLEALKSLKDERAKAQALKQIGNTVLNIADEAGYTGPGASIAQYKDIAGSITGSLTGLGSNSDRRLQARAALDSIASQAMQLGRVVGGGAVSDFETRLIMSAAPGSDKRPEQNKLLANLYKARGTLAEEQANFKEAYYGQLGTLRGADEAWQQYLGDFQLTGVDQSGQILVNDLKKQKGDWRSLFFGDRSAAPQPAAAGVAVAPTAPTSTAIPSQQSAATQLISGEQASLPAAQGEPSLLGRAWQGIKEAPGAVTGAVKGLYNFASAPLETIQRDPLAAIDTVGNVGTGTFGALAGGAAGLPLAPFTYGLSVPVGAALGALGGQYGYKKGKQLTGAEQSTTLAEDLPDLAYGAGQNLALAAAPKVVKTGAKAVTSLPKALARGGESFARGLEKEALGVRPIDIRRAPRGKLVDAEGNPVGTAADVVEEANKIETALTRLEKEGFFKKTKDTDASVKANLQETIETLGKEKAALVQEASDLIDARLGAGKYHLKPKWKYAEEYIEKKADPVETTRLEGLLDEYKQAWDKTGGSLEELDSFKRRLTSSRDWGTTAAEQQDAGLRRALYRGFREAVNDNFEGVMKQAAPEKSGQLARALARLDDYKQFESTVPFRKGVKSRVTDYGNLFLGGAGLTGALAGQPAWLLPAAGRMAARAMPIAASRVVRGATAPARALAQTGDVLVDALERIPREAVIGGASGQSLRTAPAVASEEGNNLMAQRNETDSAPPSKAPQSLIDAVIKAESGGKMNAVSPKGAKGLMQLMDATGKEWHKRLGLPGEYDPFDYQQNVLIGSAYLNWLIGKYGSRDLALAAYNWGTGNLDKLIERKSTKDFASLKKELPKETQAYVQQVKKNEQKTA